MAQTVMISVLLLLFSTGAAAQGWHTTAFADKNDNSSHDLAELQGCLQWDQEHAQYILINKNNEYQRLSKTSALHKLVGHEVKITGKSAIRTIDLTPAGGASNVVQQPYIQVKTVQDVAPNCHEYGR